MPVRLHTFFLVSALLLTKLLWSQEQVSCNTGPIYIPPPGSISTPFLVEMGNHYYNLRLSNKTYLDCRSDSTGAFLDRYDHQLRLVESIPVTIPGSEYYKKPKPRDLWAIDKHFYIFADEMNVAARTGRTLLFILDTHGKMTRNAVLPGVLTNLETSSEGVDNDIFRKNTGLGLFHDNKRSRFLFTQIYPPGDIPQTKINARVYDTRGTLLWEKFLTLEYDPLYCDISKIILYGEDLFFTLTIQLPFAEPVYKIITYNHAKDEMSYYNFSLDNKKIESIETGQVEAGNIYLYGLYSNLFSENKVDGLFFYLFNETNKKILTYATTGIDVEPYKSISKDDLKNLHAREIYLCNNGDIVFIGEIERREIMSFQDSEGKLYFRPYYHSNQLLVTCFDHEATLKWEKWVPKLQYRPDKELSGYMSILNDSLLYLLYNDHPKNLHFTHPDEVKQMKSKSVMTIAEIDISDGTIKKDQFSCPGNTKNDIMFRKDYSFKISDLKLIMITGKEKQKLIEFQF